MGHVDNRGGCAYVWEEDKWEIFVSSPQFFCETNIAVKIFD